MTRPTTTTAQRGARVQQLRQQAREIGESIIDMTRTLIRLGDASDWRDSRIETLDLEIRRWEEIREGLLARAREIEAGSAA